MNTTIEDENRRRRRERVTHFGSWEDGIAQDGAGVRVELNLMDGSSPPERQTFSDGSAAFTLPNGTRVYTDAAGYPARSLTQAQAEAIDDAVPGRFLCDDHDVVAYARDQIIAEMRDAWKGDPTETPAETPRASGRPAIARTPASGLPMASRAADAYAAMVRSLTDAWKQDEAA